MRRSHLKELIVLTMLGTMLNLVKWALHLLPNIELVSLLIMVYTYKFGFKALIPTYVFVGLEIILYGINIWNIMYLYVWALLVLIVLPLRGIRKGWVFALVSGAYGLGYGALCAVPYVFTLGWQFALSWFISGLPYDVLHGAGNFIAAFALYMPLTKAIEKMR